MQTISLPPRHAVLTAVSPAALPALLAAVLSATLSAVLSLASAPAAAQAGAELAHKVAPGDTLERLAHRFMEQPRRYPEVARLNGLRDQDALSLGQVIRIPARYLKMQSDTATVMAVKGAVSAGGKPLAVGDKLNQNSAATAAAGAAAEIITGADGQVTLKLADDSEIRLQPNTRASIAVLKRNPASGARDIAFNLLQGRLETDVTPGKGDNSKFSIVTPNVSLGIRGTSFRASAQDGSASTEVLEGRVDASTRQAAVAVNKGFGTKANQGRPPAPPVPLLPAPGLEPLARLAETESPELLFAAVAGARQYRGIVAEDDKFERVTSEGVSAAPALRSAALRDGNYFFRARAIDAQGLEGWNANGSFRVKANPRPPLVSESAPAGTFSGPDLAKLDLVFRWDAAAGAAGGYLLQLASDRDFTRDLAQFKPDTTRHTVALDAAPRRMVYWRVRSVDAAGEAGPAGAVQAFELGARSN